MTKLWIKIHMKSDSAIESAFPQGNVAIKKSRSPQRDEIVIRVTTQFYVWIAPEHLIRYSGHCLDTLSL